MEHFMCNIVGSDKGELMVLVVFDKKQDLNMQYTGKVYDGRNTESIQENDELFSFAFETALDWAPVNIEIYSRFGSGPEKLFRDQVFTPVFEALKSFELSKN
jgi:hypothetical protein